MILGIIKALKFLILSRFQESSSVPALHSLKQKKPFRLIQNVKRVVRSTPPLQNLKVENSNQKEETFNLRMKIQKPGAAKDFDSDSER